MTIIAYHILTWISWTLKEPEQSNESGIYTQEVHVTVPGVADEVDQQLRSVGFLTEQQVHIGGQMRLLIGWRPGEFDGLVDALRNDLAAEKDRRWMEDMRRATP